MQPNVCAGSEPGGEAGWVWHACADVALAEALAGTPRRNAAPRPRLMHLGGMGIGAMAREKPQTLRTEQRAIVTPRKNKRGSEIPN